MRRFAKLYKCRDLCDIVGTNLSQIHHNQILYEARPCLSPLPFPLLDDFPIRGMSVMAKVPALVQTQGMKATGQP